MFIVAVTDKPQEQEAKNTTTATATATSNGTTQVITPAKRCTEEEAGTSGAVFKPSAKKRKREERVQHAQVFKEYAEFSKDMQTKLLEVETERNALLKQMLEKM